MRAGVRIVPWILAVAGLGLPWVASGFAGWPYVFGWAAALGAWGMAIRTLPAGRRDRIALPLILLPVLFVLGIVGGWYLIPADVAWLLVEVSDQRDGRAIAGPVADDPAAIKRRAGRALIALFVLGALVSVVLGIVAGQIVAHFAGCESFPCGLPTTLAVAAAGLLVSGVFLVMGLALRGRRAVVRPDDARAGALTDGDLVGAISHDPAVNGSSGRSTGEQTPPPGS